MESHSCIGYSEGVASGGAGWVWQDVGGGGVVVLAAGLLLVRGEQAGAGGGERWGRGAKERAVR